MNPCVSTTFSRYVEPVHILSGFVRLLHFYPNPRVNGNDAVSFVFDDGRDKIIMSLCYLQTVMTTPTKICWEIMLKITSFCTSLTCIYYWNGLSIRYQRPCTLYTHPISYLRRSTNQWKDLSKEVGGMCPNMPYTKMAQMLGRLI